MCGSKYGYLGLSTNSDIGVAGTGMYQNNRKEPQKWPKSEWKSLSTAKENEFEFSFPCSLFYWNKLIANFHCIIDGACVKGRIPRPSPSSSEVRINLLEEFMHPSFPQLQHDSRFHGGVHKVHRNNLRWKHKNSSEDLCIHEGLATCTMAAQRSPLKQPAATRPAPARPRPSLGRIRPWRSSIEHQRNQAWPHRPLQKHPWGYSLA